jgi:hypothetical protein
MAWADSFDVSKLYIPRLSRSHAANRCITGTAARTPFTKRRSRTTSRALTFGRRQYLNAAWNPSSSGPVAFFGLFTLDRLNTHTARLWALHTLRFTPMRRDVVLGSLGGCLFVKMFSLSVWLISAEVGATGVILQASNEHPCIVNPEGFTSYMS